MISPTRFLQELKSRNVRKTMAIYISTALTTIGILKLFAETYNLPTSIFPIVVTLFACGLGSAFVVGWYHGKQGSQLFPKREILFHALMLLAAGIISFRVAGTQATIAPHRLGKSIAVLPFKNMSDSKEDEYFSDGVMEDILTQLSKIGDLNVISRTSSMKYKNSGKSIREIGEELGVTTILEGSVRRNGNHVRIVSQLIDAKTDDHIWAETYDREMKDIFAIQTDVAQRIARELKAQLSPNEKRLITKEITTNPDAYDAHLIGRDYYYRSTKVDNERAIELFKKAIALDPQYVLAYTGLADAYARRYQNYGFAPTWIDSSIGLSTYAISLDPDIAEPYKSLGLAYYQKEWYQKALQQYRKALSLNPNFAAVYANMGELLDWTGRQDEAIPLIKKSMRLAPGRVGDYQKLAAVYNGLGMDSAALTLFRKIIALQPSYSSAFAGLADLYVTQGNSATARLIMDSVRTKNPDDAFLLMTSGNVELSDHRYDKARVFYQRSFELSADRPGLATLLGFTLIKTGHKKEGEQLLDQSLAINKKEIESLSEEGQRRYDLAQVYAIRGQTTTALAWLREALERGSGIYRVTEKDPLLENLQGQEEFKQLIAQLNSKVETMRAHVETQERAESQETNP